MTTKNTPTKYPPADALDLLPVSAHPGIKAARTLRDQIDAELQAVGKKIATIEAERANAPQVDALEQAKTLLSTGSLPPPASSELVDLYQRQRVLTEALAQANAAVSLQRQRAIEARSVGIAKPWNEAVANIAAALAEARAGFDRLDALEAAFFGDRNDPAPGGVPTALPHFDKMPDPNTHDVAASAVRSWLSVIEKPVTPPAPPEPEAAPGNRRRRIPELIGADNR